MRLKRGVPVLSLGDGAVQIGVNRPLVLNRLSRRESRALALLESSSGLAETAIGPRLLRRLASLEHAGLLEQPAPRALAITVHGSGPAAEIAAGTLTAAGVTIASADCRADAVLGFAVGAPPAPAIQPLMALDVPHLWTLADEDGATVGPWVEPGAGACTRCIQLHRTDDNPAWPLLALQLERRPLLLDASVAHVAGTLAAHIAMAHLRSGARWGLNCQWRVGAGGPPQSQPVWPHSDCGCGAEATSSRISAP